MQLDTAATAAHYNFHQLTAEADYPVCRLLFISPSSFLQHLQLLQPAVLLTTPGQAGYHCASAITCMHWFTPSASQQI
jgi:hypothetical protein